MDAYWILAMTCFFATGQIVMALLFVTGLVVPLAFIVYEYWKYRKK